MYRATHKEYFKRYRKDWYENNKEKSSLMCKKWRENHPEYESSPKRIAWRKLWNMNNVEKIRKKDRDWKASFYKDNFLKMREYAKQKRVALKDKIFIALGGKCLRCSFDDYRALQIDHVNGDSSSDKELMSQSRMKYYSHVLVSVQSGFKKYQLLCANCNWIKKSENNEVSRCAKYFVDVKVIDPNKE